MNILNLVSKTALLTVFTSGLLAAPAYAQLGGVTGTVDTTVRSSTRIDTAVRAPSPDVWLNAPASANIGARSRSYGPAYHYHGAHGHHHGRYDQAHFHNDSHSHTHGYAQLSVEIRNDPQPVALLLTYQTEVESRKGKNLGKITGLVRSETGSITAVTVEKVDGIIPVETLRAEGDILVTSRSKKSLK